MNPATRPVGNPGSSQSTTALGIASPKPQTTARRCMALVPGTTSHLTDELHNLLRRRLRVAGLIGLAGLAIFFIKSLVAPNTNLPSHSAHLAIHAIVVALMTFLCALLWTRIRLSMKMLRLIELGLFGSMALFFAYIQVQRLQNPELIQLVTQGDHENLIASLATMTNSLPWFVLLVLYGTFIPNTWKRCAAVVSILVATPIVLTLVSGCDCPIMSKYLAPGIFNMAVVLGMGGAIAIFGSYRVHELREEAMQARKLGQYRLVRRLGGGGMGEVYLGQHTLLRRECAIKLIRPDQAGDPTNLTRFEREVQTMATLTHWNTVEIYDYGHAADGTFYYVMEYLPGLTLQELVDQYGPLPPGRAIHFLRQLCAALREAHAIGLIHRDIKPNNVIACQRGGVADVAKLLDFGLVVHNVSLSHDSDANKLTMQGTILGSPPFISPEQAMGKSEVDSRADIYSLGGLGYFLLTGQPPFVRETAMELLVAHLREPVAPLRELRPDVPHDLEEVILKCLSKNPADRYPDAVSLDTALAACSAAGNWDADSAEAWWSQERDDPENKEKMAEAITVGQ